MIQALALLVMITALPATAEAKTRADCDRIENPMLFNECLASLAPERQPRARRIGRSGEPVVERRTVRRAARAADPVKSIGRGRKRIEFTVR